MATDETRELIEAIKPASILPPGPNKDLVGNEGYAAPLAELLADRRVLEIEDDRLPGWWTPDRDKFLWRLMLSSDVMSGAIFSTSAKLASIPISVIPKVTANARDRRVSNYSDVLLQYYWYEISSQAAIDWQTHDNGCFIEVLGGGDPGGPIDATQVPGTRDYVWATGLNALDSQKCVRTGDPEYPVKYVYTDQRGYTKEYRFHHTRIIFDAQMSTTRQNMFGVGICGMSRTARSALRLNDIDKVERGNLSGKISQIIFSRVLTAEQVEQSFIDAELKSKGSTESGEDGYRMVFIGIKGAAEVVRNASIERIPLMTLPEGYNPEVYMNLAVNIISMGLGFDSRELWPATVRGATRADAEVQDTKAKRKTPGLWTNMIVRELGRKWAPPGSLVSYLVQDDDQDKAKADLNKVRAETYRMYMEADPLDHTTVWELMLEDGILSQNQYDRLILEKSKFEEMINARDRVVGNSGDGNKNPGSTNGGGGK